jgi:CDP-diacylglycerol--serine O-phosphatidyltransferase
MAETATTSTPAESGLAPRPEPHRYPGADVHRSNLTAGPPTGLFPPAELLPAGGLAPAHQAGPAHGPAADPIVTLESPPLLTGERTPARRRRFIAVNACTVSSLVLGMGAILLAIHGEVRLAAFALLACVVFDGLDGALARKLGVSTPFGAQMDSLADMCSFGIATPIVAYAWLVDSTPAVVVGPICALVGVCAAIRLARFNVSPKNGCYFCGVPTTMAAAIIVLSTLLLPSPGPGLLAGGLAVLGLLMVSTFPYMKIGQLRRLPPWLWALGAVAAWVDPPTTFSFVVGAYLLSGPLLWARQRRAVAA